MRYLLIVPIVIYLFYCGFVNLAFGVSAIHNIASISSFGFALIILLLDAILIRVKSINKED